MNADTPPCPHYFSELTVKNGHIHNGNRNHKRGNCGRQFIAYSQSNIISPETKEKIEKLLLGQPSADPLLTAPPHPCGVRNGQQPG